MKKFSFVFVLVFVAIVMVGCSNKQENIVRIHIRAHSNSSIDQSIKLQVRDNLIDYITPLIAQCDDSDGVKYVLGNNISSIKAIADNTLRDNGFDYCSTVRLDNEYFPTRNYAGQVFSANYYDALIVELGSGSGDNWWCVAYPPLCFVGEETFGDSVQYKSKILELINKYLGRC